MNGAQIPRLVSDTAYLILVEVHVPNNSSMFLESAVIAVCLHSYLIDFPTCLNSHRPSINLASYPVPRPAFRRLQYGTASDEKLGVGLGMRLPSTYVHYRNEITI